MAKYSVKFEIEVIVDEDFEVGEIDEILVGKNGECSISDSKYNDIVCDAIGNIDTDDLSGNVTEITRVEDEEDDRRSEMPWDYGKHFE